ncbi:hypothetical protein SDRG_02208 [Saprolegnia diclina VS20]|uniref:Uncharacterized protein n=1 Tax=Saprolegnia diclina (strain VS20) TaxID=1156394 RepID=T0R019_SAPDV|nr:hypothetical protein SDRG_02208 [Saprolegnia diclina VS20]EQC40306.1 hypothetical protein SDRG_02208 [Saprolegnia diclina VS20]|eukprot:XP_008606005.1 hypothetical protein SDRG_02208 [Saprolegnia diclina VS20]
MATLPQTLRKLCLSSATMSTFPTLPKLEKLDLWTVALTSDAFASLSAQLAASDSLVRLKLAEANLPKDQLETILYTLPRVLSRQKQVCCVHLSVSIETEMLVTAVLFLTRNTRYVWLDLTADDSLDLAMSQRLLAALEELETYAALHGIEYFGEWFHSPRRTPWLAPA